MTTQHNEQVEKYAQEIRVWSNDYENAQGADIKQAKEELNTLISQIIADTERVERERVSRIIQDNIWPGEKNKHTNNILKAIKKKIITPPLQDTPISSDKN